MLPTPTAAERSERTSRRPSAVCDMPTSFHEDVVKAMKKEVVDALKQSVTWLRWARPHAAYELGKVEEGGSATIVLSPRGGKHGLSWKSRTRARAKKKAARYREVVARQPDASFYRTPSRLPIVKHAMLTDPSNPRPGPARSAFHDTRGRFLAVAPTAVETRTELPQQPPRQMRRPHQAPIP